MDEINIGAEIVFNITGSHNIGYAKWERYIGTVLSKDYRSRLYVRTKTEYSLEDILVDVM